jgi:FkbM family methyltransferase
MRCAVITPIGPGHESLFQQCSQSVQAAIQQSQGPFSEISIIVVDDTSGAIGRSAARNEGVRRAKSAKIEWLFFLDADDLLFANAFDLIKQYVNEYDAIWGTIVEVLTNSNQITLRIPQIVTIRDIKELILFDPYITLQMGHFVRTEVAEDNPFIETMNTGEDFDYYLRVWSKFRCIKIREPLFVNRRGFHSIGPRSADGRQWRIAVEERIEEYKKKYGVDTMNTESIQIINTKSLEYIEVAKSLKIADHDSYFQLSRMLPYYGYYTVTCYESAHFVMFSNNDDLVVNSIMWTGSYEPMSLSIWARLTNNANLILDIGAYTGIYGYVAVSRNKKSKVICFEPLDLNFSRIWENITLNSFSNISALPLAVSDKDGEIDLNIYSNGNFLTSGSSTKQEITKDPCLRKKVQSISIDTVVQLNSIQRIDLVKIDVEGSVKEVLEGMRKTLEKCKPDFIIEVLQDIELANYLTSFFKGYNYNFFEIKEDNRNIKQTNVVTSGSSLLDLNRLLTLKSSQELQLLLDTYGIVSHKLNVLGLN